MASIIPFKVRDRVILDDGNSHSSSMASDWDWGWHGEIKEFYHGGIAPSTQHGQMELAIILFDRSARFSLYVPGQNKHCLPQFHLSSIIHESTPGAVAVTTTAGGALMVTDNPEPQQGDRFIVKSDSYIGNTYGGLYGTVEHKENFDKNFNEQRWVVSLDSCGKKSNSFCRSWFTLVGNVPKKKEVGCECGAFKVYGAPKGSPLHTMPGRGLVGCAWAAKDNLK